MSIVLFPIYSTLLNGNFKIICTNKFHFCLFAQDPSCSAHNCSNTCNYVTVLVKALIITHFKKRVFVAILMSDFDFIASSSFSLASF